MKIEDQRHVVVIGSDSGSLSEIGLRLARRLHRPFLDNCGLRVTAGSDVTARPVAAQDRLERMLAQSTPSVITVSTADRLSVPDPSGRPERPAPWVVMVDSSGSVGVQGDDDVRADMFVDPTEAADDEVLDRVAEEFHSARPGQ